MGTIKFKMYHSLTHSLTSTDYYDSTVIVTQGFIDHLYVNFDILVIFISLFFWYVFFMRRESVIRSVVIIIPRI